jgi:endonuclease YncB( thermonuclease family)
MLRFCVAVVLALLPLSGFAGPQGVVHVIDADTWDVGGARVRLYGIDAPELAQACTTDQGGDWACGHWATKAVVGRYQNTQARCARVTTDHYGRIVATCLVDGQDVGEQLVSGGIAFAYRRYSMAYDMIEKTAARAGRGVWSSQMLSPAEFRVVSSAKGKRGKPGCLIKGNISTKGVRIFHEPGQTHYARTQINPAKGEQWFCDPSQATRAGWRRANR